MHIPHRSLARNLPPLQRSLLGFTVGFIVTAAVTHVLVVNHFDYNNIRRGIEALMAGQNPWQGKTKLPHFYNPPFSVLFLWPLLFLTPRWLITLGGALITAVIFYRGQWPALTWFATNMFLWLVAAGQIDMYVMGAGLLLLFISDDLPHRKTQIFLRVVAYGFLLIKPQGGLFVVLFHFLSSRDFSSILWAAGIYGLPFAPLYPSWLRTLWQTPPPATAHITILGKIGWGAALLIAALVVLARRWTYWGIGGAFAGILSPYGMVGIPTLLLLLEATEKRIAAIVVCFSACLSWVTWPLHIPPGVDFYAYVGQFTDLYHLVIFGVTLTLLLCERPTIENNTEQSQLIDLSKL